MEWPSLGQFSLLLSHFDVLVADESVEPAEQFGRQRLGAVERVVQRLATLVGSRQHSRQAVQHLATGRRVRDRWRPDVRDRLRAGFEGLARGRAIRVVVKVAPERAVKDTHGAGCGVGADLRAGRAGGAAGGGGEGSGTHRPVSSVRSPKQSAPFKIANSTVSQTSEASTPHSPNCITAIM